MEQKIEIWYQNYEQPREPLAMFLAGEVLAGNRIDQVIPTSMPNGNLMQAIVIISKQEKQEN